MTSKFIIALLILVVASTSVFAAESYTSPFREEMRFTEQQAGVITPFQVDGKYKAISVGYVIPGDLSTSNVDIVDLRVMGQSSKYYRVSEGDEVEAENLAIAIDAVQVKRSVNEYKYRVDLTVSSGQPQRIAEPVRAVVSTTETAPQKEVSVVSVANTAKENYARELHTFRDSTANTAPGGDFRQVDQSRQLLLTFIDAAMQKLMLTDPSQDYFVPVLEAVDWLREKRSEVQTAQKQLDLLVLGREIRTKWNEDFKVLSSLPALYEAYDTYQRAHTRLQRLVNRLESNYLNSFGKDDALQEQFRTAQLELIAARTSLQDAKNALDRGSADDARLHLTTTKEHFSALKITVSSLAVSVQ